MSLPQFSPTGDADRFLYDWVRPRAQQIDQELPALVEAVREMGKLGLLGLRVPKEYGGRGLDDPEFRKFQETSARCSGSLAFLQTQHQSACGFIAKSDNERLKSQMLPKLATGELTAGIAFSQLRRPGKPVLTATPDANGYLIAGKAPWVTGWGIFQKCVTAATLPDGDTLFFLHELVQSDSFKVSPPMKLAAMEVAQTVSAEFFDLLIPNEDVLYMRPGNWIEENDMVNIALQSPFALGCAQAAIDLMREVFEKKSIPAIAETADALESELSKCREEAYSAMENKGDTERTLNARAWAIELSGRCAHAAVTASSGAGNSMSHPAQRIYREVLVFTVSAQTTPIMSATLNRLRSPGRDGTIEFG